MAAEMRLQERMGDRWWRGLMPMLRREQRKWWGARRWLVQSFIWVALLNGLLAFALYLLPQMAAADGVPISQAEAFDVGRQMFFGLGVLGLALGAIVLLQDAIIEEKMNGTAEWLLSKPLARPAYVIAKLLPTIFSMAVTMLLLPGVIGYLLFLTYNEGTFTLGGFLASGGIVALHLFFYITLVLMLGVLFNSRAPLLGVALLSLFGGSFIPVAQIVQFTPWKLGDLVVLPMMGEALPPIAMMMLMSTAIWSIIFIAVAIWRFNQQEF